MPSYKILFVLCAICVLATSLFAQMTWIRACSLAAFGQRSWHSSVVFDNKMWVIGGGNINLVRDVWYSSDGINWSPAAQNAPWPWKAGHTSVVFKDSMWIMGGHYYSTSSGLYYFFNDIWNSADGQNWNYVCNGPWLERAVHSSVVYNNKIWILGGLAAVSPAIYVCDVWSSVDGRNWVCETIYAGWGPRRGHSSVVFDNKMWVIGGGGGSFKNDVWYSTNGKNWTCACSSAPWVRRCRHTSVVFGNKMWVIGGWNGVTEFNDVWYSTDGVNWTCACSSAPWLARNVHTSLVFNNKMWVIGGKESTSGINFGDVWYSTGLGIEEDEITSLPVTIKKTIEIYPNPASSYVTIRLPQHAECIKIYDVTGILIKEEKVQSSKIQRVSLNGIKSGVYFVKVNDEMIKEKLVITR